jgi:DNA-binding beta-propeller fold protein YncE
MMKRASVALWICCCLSAASGQWLERQVVIGDTFGGFGFPEGIVVNPMSGNVYVETSPVQVFNPTTREKVRSLSTWGTAAFCPSSGKGYLFGARDSVIVIDGVADTVIGRRTINFQAEAVACSPLSNRLYLGASDSDTLVVFDPEGDSVLHKVDVRGDVRRLLWDSESNRLYIGMEEDSGLLKVLDCTADTLLPGVRTGISHVFDLALSITSHKLYCAGADHNWVPRVVAVSTDSLGFVDTVPGLPVDYGIIYSPVTDRLYASHYGEGLYVVDCRNDSIRNRLDLPLSELAVSSLDGKVYASHHDSALILVVDTTDAVVGSIRTPGTGNADALAFWPKRNEICGATDGAFAFIVDAVADTLTAEINYQTSTPYRMVYNAAVDKLYLFCYERHEVLVVDSTFGTPKRIPMGNTGTCPLPVLDQALNRFYAVGSRRLRVIDCNTDSIVGSQNTPEVTRPIPVLVPYLNEVCVFSSEPGDTVYAYDGLRDELSSLFRLPSAVTSAVYDARSNRVFFACGAPPAVRVLDPRTDSVVKTFEVGDGSLGGRLAANPDLGQIYYTTRGSFKLYTIDVLADSVVGSVNVPWNVDTLMLNRGLGKLYMCSRETAAVLVFDCGQGAIVDTIDADFHDACEMNERNDKLYLRYGAVVDCLKDSVVAMLPPDSLDPVSMAWDAIDNRVFQADTSMLYVYRDELSGAADKPVGVRTQRLPTIVHGVVFLPPAASPKPGASCLIDVTGREVWDLHPGANDVRALAPGVYFIREGQGTRGEGPGETRKIVLTE